jgi:hypothetical protein
MSEAEQGSGPPAGDAGEGIEQHSGASAEHSSENAGHSEADGQTFDAAYVRGLRREAASYRERAQAAEAERTNSAPNSTATCSRTSSVTT